MVEKPLKQYSFAGWNTARQSRYDQSSSKTKQ